jgi:hypothetical protein
MVAAADGSTYQERCENEYAISKNFYALAYDQDEVIDAVSPPGDITRVTLISGRTRQRSSIHQS